MLPPRWALVSLTVLYFISPAAAQTSTTPAPIPASPLTTGGGLFLGGVPSGTPTPGVIRLTILDAMSRALDHNLGVLTADEQLGRARGARARELAGLLPNVSAHLSETRQEINLAAFGFSGSNPAFAGIPTIVGP